MSPYRPPMVLVLILVLAGCGHRPPQDDLIARLEHAADARIGVDRDGIKSVMFAYIGRVETVDGPIHVVRWSQVLTDMLAPRGRQRIAFFGPAAHLLGTLDIAGDRYPEPLFCRGGILYFAGRSDHLPASSGGTVANGNALDLSRGWRQRRMIDVYEYGSSGGVEDPIPDEAQRRRELAEWDSK